MVPEVIIKYLQEKNKWDKQTAEKFYLDGESRVTEQELREFDEELELEQKEESNAPEEDISYWEGLEAMGEEDFNSSEKKKEIEAAKAERKGRDEEATDRYIPLGLDGLRKIGGVGRRAMPPTMAKMGFAQ